ncbi:amidohydrolase family protein [Cognatilysobacter terrigena]|uniref:amidohydrolase family protein n=1 Tax=Cognatilysobacter terrigena TaxID=2488749 RepID=UPI0014152CAD|nr:amidohydrolase family protein [Lysobacter terrigena]
MRPFVPVLLTALAASSVAHADTLALVGAKVYPAPDAAPLERATVLIRDGVITAVGRDVRVPKGTTVVRVDGRTVVAGFWNSHVHLLPEPYRGAATKPAAALSEALESNFTQWGFTTIFDIASLPGDALALRKRIDRGEVIGPNILTVDAPFFPEGGTPIYVKGLLEQLHVPTFEVSTADEAAARAARQLDAGADGVKVFAGAIVGGAIGVLPMKTPIATAVVEQAHRRGKPAFAHPSNIAGLQVAMDSGVDILAHSTPNTGPWSNELTQSLVSRNMALIPTLALIETEAGADRLPAALKAKMLAASSQQLKSFADAGGQVLFGTDCGYTEAYDPVLEYRHMAAAGLDWRAILASLTTAPSARFGQASRKGRVAAGMEADLVVLEGDPATDATAFDRVQMTVRAGRIIHRAGANGVTSGD